MAELHCWNTRNDFLHREMIMKSDKTHCVTRHFLLQPVPTLKPTDNILGANQIDLILKAWSKEFTFSSGIGWHVSIGFKAAISTGSSEYPGTCVLKKTWELQENLPWNKSWLREGSVCKSGHGVQAFSKGRSLVKGSVGESRTSISHEDDFL